MKELLVKEGLKALGKAFEKVGTQLKEGVKVSDAFKEGLKTFKDEGLNTIEKLFTKEKQESFKETSDKVDNIQEKIETSSPEQVLENQKEIVSDVQEVKTEVENLDRLCMDSIKEQLNNIEGKLEQLTPTEKDTLVGAIKNEIKELNELFDQLGEIKEKLKELGVDKELLKSLDMSSISELAEEVEEVEEAEEGEE